MSDHTYDDWDNSTADIGRDLTSGMDNPNMFPNGSLGDFSALPNSGNFFSEFQHIAPGTVTPRPMQVIQDVLNNPVMSPEQKQTILSGLQKNLGVDDRTWKLFMDTSTGGNLAQQLTDAGQSQDPDALAALEQLGYTYDDTGSAISSIVPGTSTPQQGDDGLIDILQGGANKVGNVLGGAMDKVFDILHLPKPTIATYNPGTKSGTFVWGKPPGGTYGKVGTTPGGTKTGVQTGIPVLDEAITKVFDVISGRVDAGDVLKDVDISDIILTTVKGYIPDITDIGDIQEKMRKWSNKQKNIVDEETGTTVGIDWTKVNSPDAVDVLGYPDPEDIIVTEDEEVPPPPPGPGNLNDEDEEVPPPPPPPPGPGNLNDEDEEVPPDEDKTTNSEDEASSAGGGGGGGGQRMSTTEGGPKGKVDLDYLFDISGDSIFAPRSTYKDEGESDSERPYIYAGGGSVQKNSDFIEEVLEMLRRPAMKKGGEVQRFDIGGWIEKNPVPVSLIGGLLGLAGGSGDNKGSSGYAGGIPNYEATRDRLVPESDPLTPVTDPTNAAYNPYAIGDTVGKDYFSPMKYTLPEAVDGGYNQLMGGESLKAYNDQLVTDETASDAAKTAQDEWLAKFLEFQMQNQNPDGTVTPLNPDADFSGNVPVFNPKSWQDNDPNNDAKVVEGAGTGSQYDPTVDYADDPKNLAMATDFETRAYELVGLTGGDRTKFLTEIGKYADEKDVPIELVYKQLAELFPNVRHTPENFNALLKEYGYGVEGGTIQVPKGLAQGGLASIAPQGYYLGGPTDGMADQIPATIDNSQPAALSDGEFVLPADVVSHFGNGNSDAGARELYSMMDNIRKDRTGSTKQGKQINPKNYFLS